MIKSVFENYDDLEELLAEKNESEKLSGIPLDLLKDLSDFLQPFKVSNSCISSISEYS